MSSIRRVLINTLVLLKLLGRISVVLILIFVLSLIIFHLVILVSRSRNCSEISWRLVEVGQPMSCLDVLLGFSFFLLLWNLIYLVLHNHIRVVLLLSCSQCLFRKVFKTKFRISWVHLVREKGSSSGSIITLKSWEEIIHENTSHLLL